VPAELREQYEQIAARAAAAGRALDPTPVLEIATRARHDSRVFLGTAGAAGPVRVRLSRDLVTAVPAERAWTIAHELGHALRHQEGARLQMPAGLLAGSALAGTASRDNREHDPRGRRRVVDGGGRRAGSDAPRPGG